MISISAVIITYNEERNIGRCLASLEGIADEIVVVDSLSTDATQEICRKHGARVYERSFTDFADQKNYAITFAKYDYILSIDADEALSDELKKSILTVKDNPLQDGYIMNRFTNFCGQWIKHTGWYPDRKLRLFHKEKAKWVGEKIHERCEMVSGGSTATLEGDILHYSFHSIDQHVDTVNRYSLMKAEALYARGVKPKWYNYLINPAFRFFRDYVLKGGFRDGFYGYLIAKNSAHGIFLKYAKLRELYRREL